jgi:hypothetical protein
MQSEISKQESENPAKQNANKKTLLTKIQPHQPGGMRGRNQKIFGTDIHRHTIEFSKNTRTHHQTSFTLIDSVRQLTKLSPAPNPDANQDPDRTSMIARRSSYDLVSLASRSAFPLRFSAPGRCPCRSDSNKVTWLRARCQIAWSGMIFDDT